MAADRAHILSQLQKEILLMQGFKPSSNEGGDCGGLQAIASSFPNGSFPLGVVHEFVCTHFEDLAPSSAFITGILSSLMKEGGTSLWITSTPTIFPPALKLFGIQPHRIIFIHPRKEKEKLWTMEEALKCEGLCSVVAELNEFSFTESRRFQLAAESSKVTAFVLRRQPKNMHTTSVTRWRISHSPSDEESDMPGIGFPRWHVELLKVRNGQPGNWRMEWKEGFRIIKEEDVFVQEELRKIV